MKRRGEGKAAGKEGKGNKRMSEEILDYGKNKGRLMRKKKYIFQEIGDKRQSEDMMPERKREGRLLEMNRNE